MRLLNLGCGGVRPQEPEWTNLDDLHAQLPVGEESRKALDAEANYVNFVVGTSPLPFDDNTFDGVLASHFFEHWDAQDGLRIMQDCRRILKPGGVLLASVPDALYFREVHAEDRNANWPRLFDVSDPDNPIPTFFEAALWFDQHKVILTEDALWCYFTRAGFQNVYDWTYRKPGDGPLDTHPMTPSDSTGDAFGSMLGQLNRLSFSLIMTGVKL